MGFCFRGGYDSGRGRGMSRGGGPPGGAGGRGVSHGGGGGGMDRAPSRGYDDDGYSRGANVSVLRVCEHVFVDGLSLQTH